MSIDLSQFHQVFFEESLEGLAVMESALLKLGQGDEDPELIHTVFRAAHSIKGGSGTFGFTAVAGFTHVMETLLDQVRDGERRIDKTTLDLLLKSGDVLRHMLEAARDGCECDLQRVGDTQSRLEALLESRPADSPEAGQQNATGAGHDGWQIDFRPWPDLLKTGNDPVRMFRELATLGELQVEVATDRMPPSAEFDPEQCYLAWRLSLRGDVQRDQLDEIFEWVEGDCELSIEPLAAADANPGGTDSGPGVEQQATGEDPGADTAAPVQSPPPAKPAGDSSIRVAIGKIDELLNLVGELVVTQSMLCQSGDADIDEFDNLRLEELRAGLVQLERNTRELQEGVMRIRMLPMSTSFNRFPRLVHDLSARLGKKVELKISGECTELDKTVMEKIGDPLVHLVRNALDHGIEMPAERVAANKPECGLIHLNACHQGGQVIIEISDDGRGLPVEQILGKARERGLVAEDAQLEHHEILELIFEPGFSTAEAVSDVSGRGVGMDVVRRNIRDIGGVIDVESRPGEGSVSTIRLPLTLAILDGQLLTVGDQVFVMPLVSIIESLQVDPARVNTVAGDAEMYQLREDYVPIIRLHALFGIEQSITHPAEALLVVVECEGRRIALMVDELLGQQQVVIKSLETNYRHVEGLSGATILGDGNVALILDVAGLISLGGVTLKRCLSSSERAA